MRNNRYYDVSKDDIGRVSGDVVFYSEIGLLCGAEFVAGFLHDIIGPRVNIFMWFLIVSAGTAAIPFGSSPIPYLVFMRILVMIGIAPTMTNPLVIDYVERSSQGVANGWLFIALHIGVLVMNYGVFEVAKQLDLKWAFIGLGGFLALNGVLLLFMIKNVKRSPEQE